MKLNTESRFVNSSPLATDTRQFEIQPGAKAFHMLLDGIYSNKQKAVVREAVQNAYDAHLEANVSAPVRVTLPTFLSKMFIVEDQGSGMSHEFMMNGYCQVTHSTKNSTNTSVGGLGIGRLSMLAICDTYTVQTCHGDVSRTYAIFLDEHRIPSITCVSEVPSQARGTTVSTPVSDVHAFQDNAKKALLYFPAGALDIIGDEHVRVAYLIKTDEFAIRAATLAAHSMFTDAPVNIVMGPIAYPLDFDALSDVPLATKRLMNCAGLDIFADIGAVDVAPSREGLDYSKFSLRKLMPMLAEVAEKLRIHVAEYLNEGTTAIAKGLLQYDMAMHGLVLRVNRYSDPKEGIHYFTPNAEDGLHFAVVRGAKLRWLSGKFPIASRMLEDCKALDASLSLAERLQHIRIIELNQTARGKRYVSPALLSTYLRKTKWEDDAIIFARYDTPEAKADMLRDYAGCKFECISDYLEEYLELKPVVEPYDTGFSASSRGQAPLRDVFDTGVDFTLDDAKQYAVDPDVRVYWVPTKRGKPVRTDLMGQIISTKDLKEHIVLPVFGTTVRIIGVPVSHGPATKWARQTLPSIDQLLFDAATKLWASPPWRRRLAMYTHLLATKRTYNVYEDKLFGFMTSYSSHVCTYVSDRLPNNTLFKDTVGSALLVAYAMEYSAQMKSMLTLVSMYPFGIEDGLIVADRNRAFIDREEAFKARYPLVTLTADASRYNTLVPEALLHYVRLIEETKND